MRIDAYHDDRAALRSLFELAEDSATELDGYLHTGRILVARNDDDDDVIGHLQLTETADPSELELKNMAVLPERQGEGVGRELVSAALELAAIEQRERMIVATATADIGNLRFYQRQGFRMHSIERDAFTAATGYADEVIDGIPLRDRVWLDRLLACVGDESMGCAA
jgi:GNAT superfamily N-acetyltransferase